MIQETYKGRKLKVVKGGEGGTGHVGSINGQPMPVSYQTEAAIVEQLRRDIDYVDRDPVDGGRWGAYKAIGEPCLHKSCQGAW